jgi:hypothetical protein
MTMIVKYLLSLYQKTNVFRKPCCRYFPSCSDYAIEAVEKYGVGYGLFLAVKRLIRCNQFFPGGVDLVPEKQ